MPKVAMVYPSWNKENHISRVDLRWLFKACSIIMVFVKIALQNMLFERLKMLRKAKEQNSTTGSGLSTLDELPVDSTAVP